MLSNIIADASVKQFAEWIQNYERFAIVVHVSPDGDAIGSALGLRHYLIKKGKSVDIIVPNLFPDFLRWMSCAPDIVRYDKWKEKGDALLNAADVICCLDFNELSRIDEMEEAVKNASGKKIMIDHHLNPGNFCQIVISHPEACSTSELIFRLIYQLDDVVNISKAGAECIYCGMMTDTGGFTYNSNKPEIYTIISELLSKGIDKDQIYRNVYNTYSEGRLRLEGYVLYNKMEVFPKFRSALIYLDREEQRHFHYVKGDTEGFVNIPLTIKNIIFSAFIREDTEKDMVKISLRSVGSFPCNKVAADFFNGGGHLNASGGEYYGTLEEALNLFKQALVKYQDLLLAKK
ncbi:MAG: DHH family phosphoesterase [Phocaeicola sp.]|uniref:DHH family phosphoesterase n=1 Tax=Phocaeicola sp. TaxID=2773926 RepID=UPI003FA01B34